MSKTETQFKIPNEVREVSRVLSDAGFENYIVGGCVRDLLIGRRPKDWDVTTNATPEDIIKIFPKTFYENEYGTVGVVNESAEDESLRTIEITPYRVESEYSDHRHPDKIKWGKTLEEDLRRRDFTINAMALDINQKLVDPFGGEKDVEKKLIRTVGDPDERFGEDALRMFRALRLSSELGFMIELETQNSISKNSKLMSHVSKERIRDEFSKIIASENPAFALELAARLGLLESISEEFKKGIGMEQNQAHLYTVWEHLLRTLGHSAKKDFPFHVRLASFFHDIAKPHTRKWLKGQWTFYSHEVLGARLSRQILTELKFPKETVDKVTKLVRWHMFFSDTEKITLSAVRRIVRNVGRDLIWDLVDLRKSDRIGTGRPKEIPFRLRKYQSMIEEALRDPISVKQLAVSGEDIMKLTRTKPGPHVGYILEILLSEVLEDPKLNTKDHLEERVGKLHHLDINELKKLGAEAKLKNASEEEREVEKIRKEYHVS